MSVLILSSTIARAENAENDDLVKLARKHFNYDSIKSEQERAAFDEFFLNVHQGEVFTTKHWDVSKGNSWGPEATVKAEWMVWLCKNPDAVKMVLAIQAMLGFGCYLSFARIGGGVNLDRAASAIYFDHAEIQGDVDLLRAEGQFFGDSMKVSRDLVCDGSNVSHLRITPRNYWRASKNCGD